MALPWWIENARNSLQAASNSYADIQRQLDRYNKVFEVYSQASPETQMRAASVMRQAINEYNGLKRQQEENAIRIYEAQSWLNYYNRNGKWEVQQVQTPLQSQLSQAAINSFNMPEMQTAAVEEVPVITTETPWTLNNNTAATYVEANALDTDQTVNVPVNQVFANVQAQNTVKPTTPIWVTNYINSTTPKYPNTTISPVSTRSSYNYTWSNYGAGSVATINAPWTQTSIRPTFKSHRITLRRGK